MARGRQYVLYATLLVVLPLTVDGSLCAAPSVDLASTRLAGLRLGSHSVGFSIRSVVDPSRHVNATDTGVRITIATWYPGSSRGSVAKPAMTALDYEELQLGSADEWDRRRYEDDQITALCSWRHIGIVELSREQARQSLHTAGIAVRDTPAEAGRWPIVLILGGPYYLATTAETLASHGFVVVAPFRTDDQSNEVGTQGFPSYLENSIRDAEWTAQTLQPRNGGAPVRLFALGHGGGGLQALLFAMRNRNVTAVVNIDSGNFGSRTNARSLAFYSPRLLRVPYLNILRAESRTDQDQYDDFTAMAFSQRSEIVLHDEAVRHHDLSDIGRGVAVPMRIRGDAQAAVEREYADVQDTVVRFLQSQASMGYAAVAAFDTWMTTHEGASRHTVKVYPAIEPAPVVQQVIATLDASTPGLLRAAHRRDPEASVFDANNLATVIARAMVAPGPRTAIEIADMGHEIHPDDPVFLALKSEAAQAAGDSSAALSAAHACAAMPAGDDWHVKATIAKCQDEVKQQVKE